MLLILSLLIQTGDLNSNLAIRWLFFLFVIHYSENEEENTCNDYYFNLNQKESLDLLKIPEDCQENFAYALKILHQFQIYHQCPSLSLVYLDEPQKLFVRNPAYGVFCENSYSIHLSRAILTANAFTQEEIKSIIFHELGHYLDTNCQENHSNFSFYRVLLLAFFYTNISFTCEKLMMDSSYEVIITSIIVNLIIYLLLHAILCKLHAYEYFADQSSIIYGEVPNKAAINALEKIYRYAKANKSTGFNLLYPLKNIFFSTHPSLINRCEQLKNLNHVPQFFKDKTQELNQFSDELGFIC